MSTAVDIEQEAKIVHSLVFRFVETNMNINGSKLF